MSEGVAPIILSCREELARTNKTGQEHVLARKRAPAYWQLGNLKELMRVAQFAELVAE